MKAKINTLIVLISIFAVTLIAGLLAGCGEQNPKERADKLGMTAVVTYYTNGGKFVAGTNSNDTKVYRTDYYYPGTPIYNIGVDKTSGQPLTIVRDGYVFAGWEWAVLDEDDLPVLYASDSEGNATGTALKVLENGTASIIDTTGREMIEDGKRFVAVASGDKVFKDGEPRPTVGAGEHKYLVATWVLDVVLEYRLITDTDITVQDGDKSVTYKNGDVIATESFSTSTELYLTPANTPASFNGFSYINLYWDAEGQNVVKAGETIAKGETNSVIYAKYLAGTWTPVRSARDAATMLRATGNTNYFVVYDIDCTNTTFTLKAGTFGGIIDGNGKTLSNIQISGYSADYSSLFGSLLSSAKIKNLTIENVTINSSLRPNTNIHLHVLVSSVADGAEIEGVSVDTVTLKITKPDNATVSNIQYVSGAYQTGNWLYGYGTNGTDEQFESKYGKIVRNATLIINNETIVSNQEDSHE